MAGFLTESSVTNIIRGGKNTLKKIPNEHEVDEIEGYCLLEGKHTVLTI